jgi:hypothetical protein
MFNLAAGPGDPYDTFDLVTALVQAPRGAILDLLGQGVNARGIGRALGGKETGCFDLDKG